MVKTAIKRLFVVSRNYLDWAASKMWLFRTKEQEPEKGTICSCLMARKVRFRESDDVERGFGCGTVAHVESVEEDTSHQTSALASAEEEVNKIREGEVVLQFDGQDFRTEDSKYVAGCETLRLTPNGSMYATAIARK